MDLVWTATAPGLLGIEKKTSEDEYIYAMETLIANGEGYSEVHLAVVEYPYLTLGFRGGRAVVHRFTDAETVYLLHLDRHSHGEEIFSVPSIEEDADFENVFTFPLEDAWEFFKRFIITGSVDGFGVWMLL